MRAREALAGGRIEPAQAHIVTLAKDALSDTVSPEERAVFEAGLLEQARTLDPWQLKTAVKRAAARVDPSGSGDLQRAERAARQQRELVMYPRRFMYVLAGQLDPEGAAHVSAALDPLAAPHASILQGRDGRTPAREPISAARARRLACDSGLLPAVLNGTSVVMDWGTSKRLATPSQRQALALRDKGCCYPGCDRPPSWCEAHHLLAWLPNGPSNLANFALVCDAHHDLAHHDGWTIHIDHDGQPAWTKPDEPLPAEPPEPDDPDPPGTSLW